MKIGYDARGAVINNAGLGYYSRMVIEAVGETLMHSGDSDQLLLYTTEMRTNARLEPIRRLSNASFRFPPSVGFSGKLWRYFGIHNSIAADGCDIYHGLTNTLPYTASSAKSKNIVTIHDLAHRKTPKEYSWWQRLRLNWKYRNACRQADHIITISQCTKQALIDEYNIDADKIDVIYPCVAERYHTHTRDLAEEQDLIRRMNLNRKFILQVGSYEPRKNHQLTIRALAKLPEDVHLVAVGSDRNDYRRTLTQLAQSLGVAHRVHLHDMADFRDLPTLYTLAILTVIPSYYEGFSMPIIESLTVGTPIAAAAGSSLEEAAADGGVYFDPNSVDSLVEALTPVISDPEVRASLSANGQQHATHFNSARMAKQLLETYRRLAATPDTK